MHRPINRFVFLASLAWAIASAAASISVLVAEDGLEATESRHAIRHAIAEGKEEGSEEALAYLESQWRNLNRMSLWHAGTAVVLGTLSVWGLARGGRPKGSVS